MALGYIHLEMKKVSLGNVTGKKTIKPSAGTQVQTHTRTNTRTQTIDTRARAHQFVRLPTCLVILTKDT